MNSRRLLLAALGYGSGLLLSLWLEVPTGALIVCSLFGVVLPWLVAPVVCYGGKLGCLRWLFPPNTPTQNLHANYQGLRVSGDCYFGSVLSNQGGVFGKVAGAIQSAKAKSADKWEMFVNGRSVENLYF